MFENIQRIVSYIEENHFRSISKEEFEKIGNYSYRHLSRVFKFFFDESLGKFQQRLKLENGYKKLIYTQDSISDIAISCGFESIQAFSKAFKKHFKSSPLIARKNKIELIDNYIQNIADTQTPEVVYIPTIQVFYQSIKTHNYDNAEIDTLWDKIAQYHSSDDVLGYYGIISDESLITPKRACRYEACISKISIEKNSMHSKKIFGGKFLKYTHKGSYDTIEDTYRTIYKSIFKNSNFQIANTPIIECYVRHHLNENIEANFLAEIFLPLKW